MKFRDLASPKQYFHEVVFGKVKLVSQTPAFKSWSGYFVKASKTSFGCCRIATKIYFKDTIAFVLIILIVLPNTSTMYVFLQLTAKS